MTAKTLQWTGVPEADRLISTDPNALLIGYCLDQQITVEKAFRGPLDIKERLGTIDPTQIARMDVAKVEAAFRQVPAIHRFPANMAQRVHALCQLIAIKYDGDGSRLWRDASSGKDLVARIEELPGFGKEKARNFAAVVGKHLGVKPPGWKDVIPTHPTLADVTTTDERKAYQTAKRAHKAELRRQAQSK